MELLDYIDQLPTNSRLNEAIVNDPSLARQLAMRPKPKDPWSPRITEYDLHAMMTAQMISILQGIQGAVIASGGGKPKKPKPFPSPVTAVDKARKEYETEFALEIASMVGFSESDLIG